MRELLLAAAVSATVLSGAPAGAQAPTTAGNLCDFASIERPGEPGVQVGEIDGGPLVVADLSDLVANPVSATLTCSIHVGWDNWNHAGPVAVSASATGAVVVTLPPTVVSYRLIPDEGWSFCTALTVTDAHGDTQHLYWHEWEQEFSTSNTVPCYQPWGPPPPPPIWELVEDLFLQVVDPVLCPLLAIAFPPEGDVDVPVLGGPFWDCPPYGF